MSNIDRFSAYAAAFEEFFESNDSAVLEPYFSEDAVYETIAAPPFGSVVRGRDEVFRWMKASLSSLDRRFDSRELSLLEGPVDRGNEVWVRWRVVYRLGELPELVLDGEETATFTGGRICRLEDRMTDELNQRVVAWMGQYADRLPPEGTQAR